MHKENFELEQYLLLNLPRKVKGQLSKYRIASHNLKVGRGRHYKLPKEDKLCKLCGTNYNTGNVNFTSSYSAYSMLVLEQIAHQLYLITLNLTLRI